jgi:hypothetical protein
VPSRTKVFSLLPWTGGLNTSLDASMIPAGQLVAADNIVFATRGSRLLRDGINHNWDGATNGTESVIGLHDYWFGTQTGKTQKKVGVTSAGKVYSYSGGTRTALTVAGKAWSGTLTTCSMATFNNKVFIAVDGATNVLKYWDGTGTVIYDAYSDLGITSISRASSGTTRTIIFNQAFPLNVGDTFVLANSANTSYLGTFTVATISTTTVANDTITYTAGTSLTESTTADTAIVIGTLAPLVSLVRVHQGRLWANQKDNVDRLNYTPPNDHTLWGGFGDSGALDIGIGDGDPDGTTAIFPTFKGDLFVAKRTKMYRVTGQTPETYQVIEVSRGIGCSSHNSVAPVGNDDIMWLSDKGIHSLVAVASYGDFNSVDVSLDIQKTFNQDLDTTRFKYSWGCYLNTINSVAFAVTETSAANRTLTTAAVNNAVYLYNIPLKAWYRWSDIPCQSMIVANDQDKKRIYFGTHTQRVDQAFSGTNYDTSSSGSQVPIVPLVTTGQLLLDENPYSRKALKRFGLVYRPLGTHNISATIKVDNIGVDPSNQLSFNQTDSTALLGSTLTLGTSVLGYSSVLAAYVFAIDGLGHSVQVTLTQSQTNTQVEIQGFFIEYEDAGTIAEVFSR